MRNHYKTLGVTNAATAAEIRRAYRVLARRYHPDVNPGRSSEELFKSIAEAYSALSDPDTRQQHDLELERSSESFSETFDRAHEAFRRNQQAQAYKKSQEQERQASTQKESTHQTSTQRRRTDKTSQQTASSKTKKQPPNPTFKQRQKTLARIRTLATRASTRISASSTKLVDTGAKALSRLKRIPRAPRVGTAVSNISLVEASVSIHDAMQGAKRTIEIPGSNGEPRKVSVVIPPGVRSGSIVRLRRKEDPSEEIVVVVQVEHHPWLSISERGLTMEIPLTVSEAISGGKIQIPSLGDPLLVTVEPGTQSGREVRLKHQGIINRDGTRGNLFIRFIVKIPESETSKNTATEEQNPLVASAKTLDPFYATSVRYYFPRSLIEV
jgi:DnaJ-class molecular chaperone